MPCILSVINYHVVSGMGELNSENSCLPRWVMVKTGGGWVWLGVKGNQLLMITYLAYCSIFQKLAGILCSSGCNIGDSMSSCHYLGIVYCWAVCPSFMLSIWPLVTHLYLKAGHYSITIVHSFT